MKILSTIALFLALNANANVVLSTLNVESLRGGEFGPIYGVFPGQSVTINFQTPDDSFVVNSVKFELILYQAPAAFPDFRVEILKGDTQVGELLNTFRDPATKYPGGTTYLGFTSATPIDLDPNTTYSLKGINSSKQPSWLSTPALVFTYPLASGAEIAQGWSYRGPDPFYALAQLPKFALDVSQVKVAPVPDVGGSAWLLLVSVGVLVTGNAWRRRPTLSASTNTPNSLRSIDS